MKNNNYLIWTAFPEIEDYEDFFNEEYPDTTESERYDLMYELNSDLLDTERENLEDIVYNEPILVVANLGLWHGCVTGYKEIASGAVADCLYSNYDPEWYVTEDGDFCCDDHHHDGTNHYTYRVWKYEVTEDERDELRDKLYVGTATAADIAEKTDAIGGDIAKVYGWEIKQ